MVVVVGIEPTSLYESIAHTLSRQGLEITSWRTTTLLSLRTQPKLGGPKESRTPPSAVTGQRTNRYTMGPNFVLLILV